MSETNSLPAALPPEPPPITSEGDYARPAPQRQRAPAASASNAFVPATFYGVELPVPSVLKDAPSTPDLNKAISAALKDGSDAGNVPKRGYNKYHDYKFATADDIRAYVGKILSAHGLSYEQHEVGYTSMGPLLAVHYFFVLVHESGQRGLPERVSVFARLFDNKGQPDDKSLSKASVLALKDWSKSRFSIPTGDALEDPDTNFSEPDDERPPRQDSRPYRQQASYPPQFGTASYAPDEPTPFKFQSREGITDHRDPNAWIATWRKMVGGMVHTKALDKLDAAAKLNEPHIAAVAEVEKDAAEFVRNMIADAKRLLEADPEAKHPAPGNAATPEDYLAASVQRINACRTTDELQQIRDTLYTGEAFENLPAGDKLYLGLEADARRLELRIAEAKDRAALSALTHDKVHVALLQELPADRVAAIKKLADDRWAKLPEADEPARKGTSTAPSNVAANGELTDEQWVEALVREIKAAKSDAQAKAWETQAARKARLNRIAKANPALAKRVEEARDDRIAALAQARAAA